MEPGSCWNEMTWQTSSDNNKTIKAEADLLECDIATDVSIFVCDFLGRSVTFYPYSMCLARFMRTFPAAFRLFRTFRA